HPHRARALRLLTGPPASKIRHTAPVGDLRTLDPAALASSIPDVMPAWRVGDPLSVRPVAGGTLNWNFDVRTQSGRYFLRCYRQSLETERIEGEHRLTAWV